jgi:hypothetical protein
MIVAGLDMATATGVCLGEPGQMPTFWMEDLGKGQDHDVRFANALRLAHTLISKHRVGLIGIEAPIKKRHDKTSTNVLLMGIQACVTGWASMKGVRCEIIGVGTLDKHFLGRRIHGSDQRKAANRARCWQLGWNPATSDEADAGAVWDYTCSKVSRSHSIQTTSLFSEARA